MDLLTRQAIIKKINDCPIERLRPVFKDEPDQWIEKYRRHVVELIDNMDNSGQVWFIDRDTGFSEVLTVSVNRVLSIFDPIDGLEG